MDPAWATEAALRMVAGRVLALTEEITRSCTQRHALVAQAAPTLSPWWASPPNTPEGSWPPPVPTSGSTRWDATLLPAAQPKIGAPERSGEDSALGYVAEAWQ